LIVIALGFYNSGSPKLQRRLAIDRERVERLRQIAGQIQGRKELPAKVDDLRSMYIRVGDPETDQPFDYKLIDATHYELCATFSEASEDWQLSPNSRSHWAHPAGRYCYAIDSKSNPWVP
jgi:hypothetical protein